jgi:hypothetical protein
VAGVFDLVGIRGTEDLRLEAQMLENVLDRLVGRGDEDL